MWNGPEGLFGNIAYQPNHCRPEHIISSYGLCGQFGTTSFGLNIEEVTSTGNLYVS